MASRKAAGSPPPPPLPLPPIMQAVVCAAPAPEDSWAADTRSRLQKSYGKQLAPDPRDVHETDVVSSGSYCLDLILGIGGYARGRIISVSGEEHAGKTALLCLAVASIQRFFRKYRGREARVAVIDIEKTWDDNLAYMCGADPENFLILRPNFADESLPMLCECLGFTEKDNKWVQTHTSADVILYDSWSGTPSNVSGMASLPRESSNWLKMIPSFLSIQQAFLFFTNHVHDNPGAMFGPKTYESGGRQYRYSTSMSLRVKRNNTRLLKGVKVGHDVVISVRKNKLARGFNECTLYFDYETGFDEITDICNFFAMIGEPLNAGGGAWYKFGPYTAQGLDKFRDLVKSTPEALEMLVNLADTRLEEITGRSNQWKT